MTLSSSYVLLILLAKLSQFVITNMIIKTLFFISIFTVPIFALISPFSSGFQLKNHPSNKPLTINFPKQPTNDCATQNRQLKEFAKEIFKKLGIIVKKSLTNYEPKRNYPKNVKMKREMFQKWKHLLTETKVVLLYFHTTFTKCSHF